MKRISIKNFINLLILIVVVMSEIKKVKKLRKRKYSKCETRTRIIFEKLFDVKFDTIRPDFLKNPESGYNLELDGFNVTKNIAFEVQGIQHSRYSSYFHRTRSKFIEQIRRDIYKEYICKKCGIVLIVIPFNVKLRNLEQYIICKIRRTGLYDLYLK